MNPLQQDFDRLRCAGTPWCLILTPTTGSACAPCARRWPKRGKSPGPMGVGLSPGPPLPIGSIPDQHPGRPTTRAGAGALAQEGP